MGAPTPFMPPPARSAAAVRPAPRSGGPNEVHTRWGGAGHYAIFRKKAIEPIGECRHDLDICADLAVRLGVQGYSEKSEEEWLRDLTRDAIDDFDAFREHGLARLPAPEDAVAFAKEIRDPERHPFSTTSGKIEIYSMTLAANPDPCGLGTIPPIPTWIPDDADPRHADQRHPLRL